MYTHKCVNLCCACRACSSTTDEASIVFILHFFSIKLLGKPTCLHCFLNILRTTVKIISKHEVFFSLKIMEWPSQPMLNIEILSASSVILDRKSWFGESFLWGEAETIEASILYSHSRHLFFRQTSDMLAKILSQFLSAPVIQFVLLLIFNLASHFSAPTLPHLTLLLLSRGVKLCIWQFSFTYSFFTQSGKLAV